MPFIKKLLLDKINDEKFQEELTQKLIKKIDVSIVGVDKEKKFITEIYDAVQELLTEMINNYK